MLHFDKVLIKDTEFHINEQVPFSKWLDDKSEITIEPAVQKGKKDTNKGRALINFKIGEKNNKEEPKPFYIKITVVGYFTCEEKVDIVEKYGLNMVNVLLPYGRTYISSLTGLAGYQNILIQPVNVYDLFRKKDEDSKEDRA